MSKVERFNENQDFKKIQKTYNRNNLFVDNTFPPTNQSVFYSDSFKQSLKLDGKLEAYTNKVIWKRAKDICRDAHFSIDNDGHSSEDSIINELNYKKFFATTDLDQGLVGNCWFISGATGVLQNYNLFKRVIPLDNTFNETEYTGAFHFRFWQYGMWKDVVIDDYLPVDRYGQLLFCKNRDTPNEFWSSLLEKAYAKICGSYEALEGGFTSEALIDMSGGIEEVYNLNEICKDKSSKQPSSDKFWDILLSAKKKCSVIGCNIESKAESGIGKEYRMENGLVQGHAYVVTNLANVRLSTNKYVRLIRIYNPWGKVEFCGDYSDKSSKWSLVDSETKEKLEIKIDDDGEFWMSYEDWLNNFDHCQICNLTPEICCDVIDSEYETQKLMSSLVSMWQPQYFHGEWLINESAGGRGELNPAKYWTNPQYSFIINDIDLVDDDSCWIIISLMQKHTRKKRNSNNSNKNSEEYIQYRLFKAKSIDIFNEQLNYNKPMLHNQLEKIGSSGPYINKREVTKRFKLKTGAYIIVPSTYDEDIEGEFLLRIFTEKPLVKRYYLYFNHNSNFNLMYYLISLDLS